MPAMTSGATIAASDKFVAGTAASHRSPAPISANPPPSTHLGLYRSSSLEVSGIWTRVMPLRKTNATEAFSGLNPWIAVSRMLVA